MTTNTTIAPELLDQLLANYEKPEDLTGEAEEGADRARARGGADRPSRLREGRSCRPRQRQQPQRYEFEDGADRGWRSRDCGAARSGWQFRTAADRQGAEAVRRVRRQDFEPLCTRHDGS